MTIEQYRKYIIPRISAFVKRELRKLHNIKGSSDLKPYLNHIHTLAVSKGKKIRPYITNLMYHASGGRNNTKTIKIELAVELFHLFGLIHDDIIDKGTVRHGAPTINALTKTIYKADKRVGDIHHLAHAQALLCGDVVLTWVFLLLHESQELIEEKNYNNVINAFHALSREVFVGQMIDTELMTQETSTLQKVMYKTYLKTASYTFIRPMQLGIHAAGGNKKLLEFCSAFGKEMGIGFQIQDDMLDITAEKKQINKTILSDIKDRQHTVFTQYILDNGTREQKQILRSAWGKRITQKKANVIKELFNKSGAIQYGTKLMNTYFDKAQKLLENSPPIIPKYKLELQNLLLYIRRRRK